MYINVTKTIFHKGAIHMCKENYHPLKLRNDFVPGYVMDDNGTVIATKTDHILTLSRTKEGQAVYGLTIGGKRKTCRVDVLVVSTLMGGYPEDLIRITHLDGDKMNCHPSNLVPVTKSEIMDKYKDLYQVEDLNDIPEEWRVYPAIPNLEVSNFGETRDKNTKEPIRQYENHGYMLVFFNNTHYQVHRLVAELFIENPKPDKYLYVNHIDGVKRHNQFYNLEWCDISMNTDHAMKSGLYNTYTEKDIRYVCELLAKGIPGTDVAKITGINQKYVSEIYTGRKCRSISSEYTFPRRIPLEELYNRKLLITLMDHKVPPKEIARLIDVEYNQSFISYYERVRREERQKKQQDTAST